MAFILRDSDGFVLLSVAILLFRTEVFHVALKLSGYKVLAAEISRCSLPWSRVSRTAFLTRSH